MSEWRVRESQMKTTCWRRLKERKTGREISKRRCRKGTNGTDMTVRQRQTSASVDYMLCSVPRHFTNGSASSTNRFVLLCIPIETLENITQLFLPLIQKLSNILYTSPYNKFISPSIRERQVTLREGKLPSLVLYLFSESVSITKNQLRNN